MLLSTHLGPQHLKMKEGNKRVTRFTHQQLPTQPHGYKNHSSALTSTHCTA